MNVTVIKNLCAIVPCICASCCFGQDSLAETTTATKVVKTFEANPKLLRSDAFFGVHFDLHASATDEVLGKDTTPANVAAFLDAVKPDFVQYDCKGHAGYTGYPSKIGYASPGIVKDALKVWREETKKRGVGLYVHYSGVMDAAAIQFHPQWARIDENGNRDPEVTSLFSDYAKDLMIPQLKEVTSKYDLDGVWVDGDCWGAKLDYCTTAVEAWKAKGFPDAPRKPDDANWQEWKRFHREAFDRYLANWVNELHKFNPELELCSNWAYTPHMPVPIEADVDFLSGDFSAKESVDRARFEARYLDSSDKPWDLMAWGFNSYSGGAPHQMKHAEQLKQEAAVVLGLGGGMQVYYQPTRSGHIPDVVTSTVMQVADFCRQRQQVSHKSKSVPQVALLLSSTSYLHRSNSVYSPHGHYSALEGALHALLENGYSVDLLSEHQLEPRLQEYPVVVIAQAAVLEESFGDKIRSYVLGGGKLVLLDRESLEPFKADLGVEFDGPPQSVPAFITGDNLFAAVPGEWQKFVSHTASVIKTRSRASASGLTENAFSEPAATNTTLGSGNIIAVYGPLARAYFDTHNPAIRSWIGDIIEMALPNPKARVIGSPNVDMTLRKTADGHESVHLANLSGAQRADRFAVIDKIPASGNLRLEWVLSKKPVGLRLLPGKEMLEFNGEEMPDGSFRLIAEIADIPIHGVVIPQF